MPHPKVKLADDSGNAVSVTSNRLDVNAYLAATPTIDIGDVSLLLGGTAASVNNGAADATTLRVTIASDTTGVLSIDDNGGSITVDSTVLDSILTKNTEIETTVNAIQTAVEILDDWDDSNYANVNINIAGTDLIDGAGGVTSGVLRVTLAADDALTLNAVTALQIIDDWDATHDSAVTSDGVMVMGEAKLVDGSLLPNAVAEGDAARMALSLWGTPLVSLTDQYGRSVMYNEDSAHSSVDWGIMSLAVRNDTLAALAGADGDYAPFQVDSSGSLYTKDSWLKPGSGLLQTAGVTFNAHYGSLSMGVRNDTLAHDLSIGGGSITDC